jgi:outer membrane protein TolC
MRWNLCRAALAIAISVICGIDLAGQQPAPQRLTLNDAITLALKNNLSVLVAGTQVDEAAGARERQLATLLPRVTGNASANLQNRNLAVLGVSVPGFPSVVGPYAYYDFRVAASQSLIDRRSYHNWKASQNQERATKLSYQDARDLVIRQTAGLYLDGESALAQVQAAESRVSSSQALEKLAQDQHANQLATGVDVLRAQVQLARDRQSVLVARDYYQTSLLVLARFVGLPPGTPLELAEQLEFKHAEAPDLGQAVHAALEARPDYRALLSQRDTLVEQKKASRARYYPTLSVSGDYGPLGRNFAAMPGIGEIQGTLSITLFDRDRKGEEKQLESRLQRLNDQIDDLSRGIDQEIRKAVLDIESTEQQVAVTQAGLDLAQQVLKLGEDRFRNGVADNIEVVMAQSAVAAAQEDRITALARHADAQAALARALGATEQNYGRYIGGSSYQIQMDSSGGRGKQK